MEPRAGFRCRRCLLAQRRHTWSDEGWRCGDGELSTGFRRYLAKRSAPVSLSTDEIRALDDVFRVMLRGAPDDIRNVASRHRPALLGISSKLPSMKASIERNLESRKEDPREPDSEPDC